MITADQKGVNFDPYRPTMLTSGWFMVRDGHDGAAYQCNGLRVIVSAALEDDGHVWLHLSASRASRIPSYVDLVDAKQAFLGDRHAYQCFVPRSEHVNINPHVLHLWARADGARALPDFTRGSGSI